MKIIQDRMINTKELESASDGICHKCGTATFTTIELLGRIRRMPVMCKCREEEYKRGKEIEASTERRLKLERLMQYSLMDHKFRECTFENFNIDSQNEKLYKMAVKYCDKWPEMKRQNVGFLFWGAPGNGKSYLSFCIANRLLQNFVPVIAISSIGILNRIKQTYNNHGKEGEVEVINSLKNASLLVLDDLGAENDTDWSKEKLYEIIDSRIRDQKPMIVTTNLTPDQLRKKLTGEDNVARTYDRLVEMCCPIEVKGPSRRVKAAKEKIEVVKELLNLG
jgi:DNA replication protein DnaC